MKSTTQAQQDAEQIAALKEEVAKRDAVIEKQRRNLTEVTKERDSAEDERIEWVRRGERAEKENDRLKRIIAKEITENDELGFEFIYVQSLKEQLEETRDDLNLHKDIRTSQGNVISDLRTQLAEAQKEIERLKTWEKVLSHANRGDNDEIKDLETQLSAAQAQVEMLKGALEKCIAQVWLADPDWGNRSALAFASRCGLVEITAKQALAQLNAEEGGKDGA